MDGGSIGVLRVDSIARAIIDYAPLDLVLDTQMLVPIVSKRCRARLTDVMDFIEERWDDIVDKMTEQMNDSMQGVRPYFTTEEWAPRKIIGCGFIGRTKGTDRKHGKALGERRRIVQILRAMDRYDFQRFCAELLGRMGLTGTDYVHKKGSDGGIDFYGMIQPNCACDDPMLFKISIGLPLRVRIVGQSKKWKVPIKRDQMDTFSNQVDEFKRGTGRAIALVPEPIKDQQLPLGAVFFTTSYLEPDAAEVAGNNAVYVKECHQLAQDVVAHFLKDFFPKSMGYRFDEKKFLGAFVF